MKICFFLDAKLIKKNQKYYTTGAVDYEYLNNHKINKNDIINVFCRLDTKSTNQKLSLSSGDNIDIFTINSYFELIKHNKKIKEMITTSDINIIKMPTIIGCYVCHFLKKLKIKYMVEMVGDPYDSLKYKGGIFPKIIAPIIRNFNKYYIKRANFVSYVSKNYLQKKYPTKGNSVSFSDVLIEDSNENVLYKRVNKIKNTAKNSKIKFGLIGSHNVNYKGHYTAIKAMHKLKHQGYNVELHFLGSGNYTRWNKYINKYNLNDNIFSDGILPHNKIFSWFDDLDFFLIPSLTEGVPRALIEAMSRGCVCIGTEVGGIPELLDKNVLIKKNDYNEIVNIVVTMLDDRKKMLNESEKNFNKTKIFQGENLKENKNKIHSLIKKEFINEKGATRFK